jgi:hypothetical protein
MTETKRGRGRPPKADEEVKRHALGVRTTRYLKERLEAAAAMTGRSLAQEVEHRLEQSFRSDPHIGLPLDLLRNMIEAAEVRTGQQWTDDYMTWVAVKKASELVLSMHRPEPPNRAAINEAEVEFVRQAERWKSDPIMGERLVDGTSTFDFPAYEAAAADRESAREQLRTAAATAKEMAQEGRSIADEVAEYFRLRPTRS